MKTFKFTSYSCGSGAECLSGTDTYFSTGVDLNEAKEKLVRQRGCHKTYFDDPEYTTITEIPTVLSTFMHNVGMGIEELRFYKYGGVEIIRAVKSSYPKHLTDIAASLILAHHEYRVIKDIHDYIRGLELALGHYK